MLTPTQDALLTELGKERPEVSGKGKKGAAVSGYGRVLRTFVGGTVIRRDGFAAAWLAGQIVGVGSAGMFSGRWMCTCT